MPDQVRSRVRPRAVAAAAVAVRNCCQLVRRDVCPSLPLPLVEPGELEPSLQLVIEACDRLGKLGAGLGGQHSHGAVQASASVVDGPAAFASVVEGSVVVERSAVRSRGRARIRASAIGGRPIRCRLVAGEFARGGRSRRPRTPRVRQGERFALRATNEVDASGALPGAYAA